MAKGSGGSSGAPTKGFVTSLADQKTPSKRARKAPQAAENPAMASERPKRHADLAPTHPGALLREIVVPATGRSKVEIAKLLGVSRQTLYDVLAEKTAVTPQLALRLGKMFGEGPDAWLRMQAAYDVWTVSRELSKELEKIPALAAAE